MINHNVLINPLISKQKQEQAKESKKERDYLEPDLELKHYFQDQQIQQLVHQPPGRKVTLRFLTFHD